ncbi:cytochrome c oxidase accessory protein CcoG [Parvibaculum sp.]|uniref:cytochrome c oxidase accessory protein CcoG n=1 Tax=Parvibaculum sp. TaxID=2024848 RepID=UPI001D362B1D|nr:cytochrome c oxidase accessory protein CcoG [Parvibaculum sp.]MBX3489489.1 cytochrome c oxidase accessory protein CcoG [Parvibaculum sp.]MCW5726555.1 cytochrome c oxidase accessory protein CcoG [Parvibaculum sp.]
MADSATSLERLAAEAAGNVRAAADPHGADGERVTAVNSEKNRPLYASRVKVYPKLVGGTFRRLKWIVMALTLTIYYVTPWLRWDRGPSLPDQAVLLDFPARRFYFFFLEIWPQEFYYITGLLILASLGLFLVTSVAGRVWCGYTCPQTVWTDLFIHVERFFEGERSARIRLDRSPWGIAKLARKAAKHAVWILIALATGGAWVFYFADAPTLAADLMRFDAPAIAYISIAVFASTTYLLGGIAREQVCIYMCPWPRIQGAMFDEESLLVSYKDDRGEKRGPHKKGTSWEGRGDCIDCGQCVAVCPMGIDIRDGMQLECIQCALCIDACDAIMDRVERPRGLIAYDTLSNQQRRKAGEPQRLSILRPRTIVYMAAIALVALIMLVALVNRSTLEISALPDRNPLFVTLADGSIRNGYELKILNKEHRERIFRIDIEGLEGAALTRPALAGEEGSTVIVGIDTLRTVKFFVSLPADKLDRLRGGEGMLTFVATDLEDGTRAERTASFRGPAQ